MEISLLSKLILYHCFPFCLLQLPHSHCPRNMKILVCFDVSALITKSCFNILKGKSHHLNTSEGEQGVSQVLLGAKKVAE